VASAQVSLSDVVSRYDQFRKSQQSSRLHLVFNQDRYTAGDTVWFKAYFFNNDLSPVKGRQLVDLSLVSPEGNELQHFLFSVNNGIGWNQVVLPSNTQPGIYGVTAYNSWMKNFDPPPLFNSNLFVVDEKVIEATEQVSKKDFSITMRPATDGVVTIAFSAHEGSLVRYHDLMLIVTNNDKILHASTFRQGIRASVPVEVKESTGVNHVSIIDKAGRVVATDSYKLPTSATSTIEPDLTVKIEGYPEDFNIRQKAKLTVSVVDKNNQPVTGEFSVKVLNGTALKDTGPLLGEQLSAAELRKHEPWRQVLNFRSNSQWIGFTTDLHKNGTAFFSDGTTPLPAGTKLVFYLQEHDIVLQAYTSSGGKFTLPLPDIIGKDELIAIGELNDQDVPGLRISWNEKLIELPAPPASRETNEQDEYGVFSGTRELIDKSFGFYASLESGQPVKAAPSVSNALEERLNGPDNSVDVTRYVTFETMTELIREIIPSLQSRMVGGKVLVQVGLSEPMAVAKASPLYIIDNVVTRNTGYFLSMKPSEIATVKVVRNPAKLLPLGLLGKNGIVIVETIKGDARPPVEPWQIIEGINAPIPFRAGTTDRASVRRPDFRSTIFWAPMVKTGEGSNGEIEFYCSDDVGDVNVRVDGVTKDGRVFSGEKSFKIELGKK
jgi:hypothetical protein